MRNFVLVAMLTVAVFITSCSKKEETESATPVQESKESGKPLPVLGVSKATWQKIGRATGAAPRTIVVRMRIVGTSILDTKRDNDPFHLLLPEVTGHEAFILADEKYGMTSGSSSRPLKRESTATQNYDVMLLDDDDLSITPGPNEPLRYTLAGGSCPQVPTDLQSLRWAPSMSDALGKNVHVNPKFLRASPESAGLAARMKIDMGDLFSTPTYYEVWQFKTAANGTTGHKQMLTAAVVHEYSVDLPAGTDVLTINTTKFAAGSTGTTLLTLEPDSSGEIEFTIGSIVPKERLPGTGTASDEDMHYMELYKAVVDTAGSAVSSAIHPFKVVGERCVPPTTTLVNCGPGRP
jgi:hypothetical protein